MIMSKPVEAVEAASGEVRAGVSRRRFGKSAFAASAGFLLLRDSCTGTGSSVQPRSFRSEKRCIGPWSVCQLEPSDPLAGGQGP
jgi:hypothetical protein